MSSPPTESVTLWDEFPIGISEHGESVTLRMPERSLLVAGEPGGGKSSVVNLVTAVAALDTAKVPTKLWLLDAKFVELAPWAHCAEAMVGTNVSDAVDLLRGLQASMDERYQLLLASGRRKVAPEDGLGLDLLVCDELAYYVTATNKAARNEFIDVFRDVLSRGRASGHIVVAATQKPSTEVVPSSLRDLFQYRLATRCATPQMSDTCLGSGWAAMGYSASTIDPATRGVGYLLADGGLPVRMRSYYLTDEDVASLSTRARLLRGVSFPGADR